MGFRAATAKRNTSNMKISRTSLLSWSRERFQIISDKHTGPWRSTGGVTESTRVRTRRCVLAIKGIGELDSSDIYPCTSAVIVGSDCEEQQRGDGDGAWRCVRSRFG